jgi:hypothetical protein
MFLIYILVPYIVRNFSDYNCYQLNIHLDSRLNIQELYSKNTIININIPN